MTPQNVNAPLFDWKEPAGIGAVNPPKRNVTVCVGGSMVPPGPGVNPPRAANPPDSSLIRTAEEKAENGTTVDSARTHVSFRPEHGRQCAPAKIVARPAAWW